MKLIIAIVQDTDSSHLVDALSASNFRSTKLATTGGFLKKGNTTIMVGCQEESVDKVLSIIKDHYSEREDFTQLDYPMRAQTNLYTMQPIMVGGATVFVLPIDSFHRF